MGIIEISLIYGAATGFLKDVRSVVAAAVLFAVISLIGLLLSPLGVAESLPVMISAWLGFNLSLFSVFMAPALLHKQPTT